MSTRGYLGLKKNGELKGTYNHFDSYPTGLGADIMNYICKELEQGKRIEVLSETFDYIQLVNENDTPTKEQQEACQKAGLVNLIVADRSLEDWYCLLREAQGNLKIYVDKVIPYMIDSNSFLEDTLFCEWAYILNLDTGLLEIYENGNRDLRAEISIENMTLDDVLTLQSMI